ncbi:MAG: hypothetical protein EA425_08765 [Puniceicoccaceae bacterium]|nr:MAG: hypothetical protein EA425_08765 [Puniceicoccaceae bacterium]
MPEDASSPAKPPAKGGDRFFDARFSIEAIQHEPYENGFTWRTVLGAFFIAFVMLPGLIFMGLMIGQDMGTAAEWVTIILFVEIARRSFMTLRKQELYMLKYTAAQLTHVAGGLALGGGMFGMLVWNRYLRHSEPFHSFGIAHQVPDWVSPYGDAAFTEPFTSPIWLPVITVTLLSMVLSKLTQLALGFMAYKATADMEKLPFPLAPINAEGAIALAETSQEKNKRGYRQYCFAIGVILGAAFGAFYVAVPTLTGAFLERPLQLIPIPFLDLTTSFESWLPAAPIGISLNLGLLFIGFVLPWRIVVGMVASTLLFQLVLNPLFQRAGWLPTWAPGKGAIETNLSNSVDLYLSIGIGVAFAILFVGLFGIARALLNHRRNRDPGEGGFDLRKLWERDRERGDPPIWVPLLVWISASIGYVVFSNHLVNSGLPAEERFSIWWLIGFAFFWTPMNTYINARMSGIAGQHAGVPFVSEGAIFLSQHRGVAIWFAPLPIANYGYMADLLRETQLTRTRFTSILKAELLVFPLLLFASFLYWSFIVGLAPIPSDNYPYVQQFWPQFATMQALWASSMQEGQTLLLDALKPEVILGSLAGSLALFSGFGVAGISAQYLYGGITTLTQLPHMAVPIFIGALLGRYVFARRFGVEKWTNYTPILAVGFAAGIGLIGMFSIAINFLWSSIGTGY